MGLFGLTTVGAAIILYGTKVLFGKNESAKFRSIVEASFRTHEICQQEKCPKINKIVKMKYGYSYYITLPSGVTIEKFKKYLPALEQDTYSKIRFKHTKGRSCILDFGLKDLDTSIPYSENLPKKGLTVPFYTHFGMTSINFHKESCWHFLLAGATGMGKSVLLRYILTHLFLSQEGKIHFYVCSNKITDFYMYRNIPQFSLAKTVDDLLDTLHEVITEARERETLLASHNALDSRDLKKRFGVDLLPIFLVIDEYGRISDVEEAQSMVQEIIETYRYVDVHVVISTQRPDAATTIKPRIRANILGSMALSVRDGANSRMIVGTDEATKLGRIKGRAILLDGFTQEVQVPYLTENQIEQYLQPFYRSDSNEQKGYANRELPKEIPGFIEGPTGEVMFRGEQKSNSRRQPSHEKTVPRRKSVHHHATKRQVLPVYAEPDYDSPEQH
jgi:Cdc6-like AAA superfamily ATPase